MAVLRRKATQEGFVYEVDFRYRGQRYRRSAGLSNRKDAQRILDELEGLQDEYIRLCATVNKEPGSVNIDRQVMNDMIARLALVVS